MKFLTINGKIQTLGGKPITVPDSYNNDLIKIGGMLVKTGTSLIGSKHSGSSGGTGTPWLTFSSPNNFTIETSHSGKTWDGALEYSTDTSTWSTWDGSSVSASSNDEGDGGEYSLYFRGIGNTIITGEGTENDLHTWIITGTNVQCHGNIENLLDYATVEAGNHPSMGNGCYATMFVGCTSLTTAPTLPATTLAEGCYSGMFWGCTSLTTAPALSATTLAISCYQGMFHGCTSLTTAPALPAITLEEQCYYSMFYGCTSLKFSATQTGDYTQAYRVPTSGTGTIASNALNDMFTNTGGTFKGTPAINTTYYLSSSNSIA